nr:MAG TPA: hypothetical protein [Caudoviricetes sp.]
MDQPFNIDNFQNELKSKTTEELILKERDLRQQIGNRELNPQLLIKLELIATELEERQPHVK